MAIAVRDHGQWRLAGAVSLHITPYSRSGEIGYWIDGGHEGRGLASRAVAAVLDHAFGALGIERVALHTDPANQRSRALARRLGFVEEGLLRQGLAFPTASAATRSCTGCWPANGASARLTISPTAPRPALHGLPSRQASGRTRGSQSARRARTACRQLTS